MDTNAGDRERPAGRGRYYEEFNVDDRFESPGRTITEADVVQYAALSGDYNQIHTDAEYARENGIYGERIAHGLLGLSIVEGLKFRVGLFEGTAIASLEWSWKHLAPILIGDTLHVRWTITKKRETRRNDRGIIWEHVELVNQRDELVSEGDHAVMMHRRP
jgi:acyl dehydratase